ncbi:MAG: hypothetical protein K2O61_02415 [Bacteroidaceae bacterium]|nr:hypothetical protein [Bacteroidaceae bacterium]
MTDYNNEKSNYMSIHCDIATDIPNKPFCSRNYTWCSIHHYKRPYNDHRKTHNIHHYTVYNSLNIPNYRQWFLLFHLCRC